jgi:NDP-sugar pyrophosphorylase family protein
VSQVVLLAGGRGTRLGPYAEGKPKVLVEVAGKPFLSWKLEEFVRNGVSHVVLLIGYGADQIESWLNRQHFPLYITLVSDGAELRGTGGAVIAAIDEFEERFFVTYGDALLQVKYGMVKAFATKNRVAQNCLVVSRPNLGFDGACNSRVLEGYVVEHSKAPQAQGDFSFLDYGLAYLSKLSLMQFVGQSGPLDLSEIYGQLAEMHDLLAFQTDEPYLEIGTPESLRYAATLLEQRS